VTQEVISARQLDQLPQGTILESVSTRLCVLGYKVTTFHWCITGHSEVLSDEQLRALRLRWRVIRRGEPQ
jgi:hypothetical protein